MKKKSLTAFLTIPLLLAGLVTLNFYNARSQRTDAVHPKLMRGSVLDECHCTGIKECELVNGMIPCGNSPCSSNDNMCDPNG